jgi:hypothetical protein
MEISRIKGIEVGQTYTTNHGSEITVKKISVNNSNTDDITVTYSYKCNKVETIDLSTFKTNIGL